MTLTEAMVMLGSFLGVVAGIVIGVFLRIGWWTIGTAILGVFVGWIVAVALSPIAHRGAERLWKREQKRKKDQAEQGGGQVR